MKEGFFKKLMLGSAPLVVWGGHFFFSYVLVAAACTRQAGDVWPVKLILAGVSLAALAATVMLTWPVLMRIVREHAVTNLTDTARAAGGVLALIAVLWTSLPVLMLPVCQAPFTT